MANYGPLHWWEDNLTYSMLTTALYHIWPEGQEEPRNEVESKNLVELIGVVYKPGTH